MKAAKWTSWRNIAPALPEGTIGCIGVLDLAEVGVLELLRDPREFPSPGWDRHKVKASRVMVDDGHWPDLARGLVKYGL